MYIDLTSKIEGFDIRRAIAESKNGTTTWQHRDWWCFQYESDRNCQIAEWNQPDKLDSKKEVHYIWSSVNATGYTTGNLVTIQFYRQLVILYPQLKDWFWLLVYDAPSVN